MNILDKIIENKKIEVAQRKELKSLSTLAESDFYERMPISLVERLLDESSTGIIAEFKRKSPSKGIINDRVHPLDVAIGYQKAGAAAISMLTDEVFFSGSDADLIAVRSSINIPILRKEFTIKLPSKVLNANIPVF